MPTSRPTTRPAAWLLAIALVAAALCHASGAVVKEVSWDSKYVYTRFVAEFDQPVNFLVTDSIAQKGYFYVDIHGVTTNYRRRQIEVNDNVIRTVDALSYQDHGVLRLVFYLKSTNNSVKVTQVANPPRIVVDVIPGSGGDSAVPPAGTTSRLSTATGLTPAQAARAAAAPPAATTRQGFSLPNIPEPPQTVATPGAPGKKKVVIIDPGHGGSNRGTESHVEIGGRKIPEKELTFQFASQLKQVIDASPNMVAIMTRTDDSNVALSDRVKFAEDQRGDLFLSIHMNDGAGNDAARGVEVFFLTERGSSDAAVQSVEKRENFEVGDHSFFGRSGQPLLKTILTDLEKGTLDTLKYESYEVAKKIIESLQQIPFFSANNRGIKDAGFLVLKNFKMPSVLVEVGFLTNEMDARWLVNPRFQRVTAVGLYNALGEYFASVDPGFRQRPLKAMDDRR